MEMRIGQAWLGKIPNKYRNHQPELVNRRTVAADGPNLRGHGLPVYPL